ncbi:MAG: hypothetical protein ACREBF_03685 [Candidatus Micrarchaeales archaeon]
MVTNSNFHKNHGHHSGGSRLPLYILGVIIVIGIVYFVGTSLLSGALQISSMQTFNIPTNGSVYFTLPNNTGSYSIFLRSSSNSSATFYISGSPILVKPIVVVSMPVLGSSNASTTGGSFANVHVTLESSSNSGVKVDLTPLPTSLNLRVSGGISEINPTTLLSGTASTTTGGSQTTTVATTVTTTATTTAVTTAPTTTISGGISAVTQTQVMTDANATNIGLLMKNFKTLYVNGHSCTSALYNSTYASKFGSVPKSYNTYANVSQVTPTTSSWSIVSVGTTLYNVTYSLTAPSSQASGKAVVLEINTGNGALVSEAYTGPFQGLNYTVLASNYNFAVGVGNSCGILLP